MNCLFVFFFLLNILLSGLSWLKQKKSKIYFKNEIKHRFIYLNEDYWQKYTSDTVKISSETDCWFCFFRIRFQFLFAVKWCAFFQCISVYMFLMPVLLSSPALACWGTAGRTVYSAICTWRTHKRTWISAIDSQQSMVPYEMNRFLFMNEFVVGRDFDCKMPLD